MLPELEAERQLAAIEASSMPHMEQSIRRNVLKRLSRAFQRRERQKFRSAAEALASLPIPIERFPKGVKQHGR